MSNKETPMMKLKSALALAIAALACSLAFAQQGVSKNEIVIGTIQDLSGPLAGYGKQARNGMQLRIDELNEQQGSIHGRQLRLVTEDDGYDPKQAVLAAQKLVNQDKVVIVAGHLGTAQNMAAMPVQFE
jgi:branched-chain amino acid transport system substrate-binding protein